MSDFPAAAMAFGEAIDRPLRIEVDNNWTEARILLWASESCAATIHVPDGMRMGVARLRDREIVLAEPWTEKMGLGEARFVWLDGETIVGKCGVHGWFGRKAWIDLDGITYSFQPRRWLSGTFVVSIGRRRVALVGPDHLFSSKGTFVPFEALPMQLVPIAVTFHRMLCQPSGTSGAAGGAGGGGC